MWKEECDVARKAKAFNTLITDAEKNPTSAKYLIEEPWNGKTVAAKRKAKETTKQAASLFDSELAELVNSKGLN